MDCREWSVQSGGKLMRADASVGLLDSSLSL